MPRQLFLPFLAAVLATGPARADCELLYAPPEIRARALAFHHANELRRTREQAHAHGAGRDGRPPPAAARTVRHQAAPAGPSAGWR